ncbi:agmatinase [Desulfitibacter alkalitolerans]|uniref:agmatinase n=1 Tax=Desulfitibacter alkalitolerans TaxID=264641 RepID=UPI00048938BE|nr:agmatinase [Desulfitibacter alkalitolerans]
MEENKLWGGLNKPNLKPQEADVTIIGLPFDEASSYRKGSALAPQRLRDISYHIPPSTEDGQPISGLSLVDIGDWSPLGLGQENYFMQVEEKAAGLFGNTFPIFIGGDHSVTIPILRAVNKVYSEPVGIVHLDAHLDLCSILEGNSLSHGCTLRRGLELDSFSLENTYFIGIRSFETQELDFIKDKKINIYNSRQIFEKGAIGIAKHVSEKLSALQKVYLTIDIDVLDPAFAPGTGTPKSGGISSRELLEMLRVLSELPLIGMDIVELSPPLDCSDITAFAAQRTITEILGHLAKKL